MTDRELLELAAIAYGLDYEWLDDEDIVYRATGQLWNPLTDDGDALRLAVKLKIPLQFPDWTAVARTWGPKHFDPCDEPTNGNLYAATRRAIVRAAAELADKAPITTGWPLGLMQDDSRKLSKALANTPGARRMVDEQTKAPDAMPKLPS